MMLDMLWMVRCNCLFWGQVTVPGLFLCIFGTDMTLNLANILDIRANTIYKQLFRESLSEKVQATILKGIVGGFEFTVPQRSLKECHERPWTFACECSYM